MVVSMKNLVHLFVFVSFFLAITMGCGRRLDVAELDNQVISSKFSRHLIGTMSFSVWDDLVVSDVGVELTADGACRFGEPTRADESTRWTPYQVYWVIFGDSSEVRNGTTLSGYFGPDDVVDIGKIVNIAGEKPVGFSFVDSAMYRVIDIAPGEYNEERTSLQTTLNVMGRKAVVRSKTFIQDGTCKVTSEACNGSVDCNAPGMFVTLGNFRVTQTLIGVPKDVSVESEPQLRRL